MPPRNLYQNRFELLQGTLDMLILQTLQWGPQHGCGILVAIRANSGDLLQIETGSLYPALHRLARKGWLKLDGSRSSPDSVRRFCRLTPASKKQLLTERDRCAQMVGAIAGVLDPEGKA